MGELGIWLNFLLEAKLLSALSLAGSLALSAKCFVACCSCGLALMYTLVTHGSVDVEVDGSVVVVVVDGSVVVGSVVVVVVVVTSVVGGSLLGTRVER